MNNLVTDPLSPLQQLTLATNGPSTLEEGLDESAWRGKIAGGQRSDARGDPLTAYDPGPSDIIWGHTHDIYGKWLQFATGQTYHGLCQMFGFSQAAITALRDEGISRATQLRQVTQVELDGFLAKHCNQFTLGDCSHRGIARRKDELIARLPPIVEECINPMHGVDPMGFQRPRRILS